MCAALACGRGYFVAAGSGDIGFCYERTKIAVPSEGVATSMKADRHGRYSISVLESGRAWNTWGNRKYTNNDQGHADWISRVRYSPNP